MLQSRIDTATHGDGQPGLTMFQRMLVGVILASVAVAVLSTGPVVRAVAESGLPRLEKGFGAAISSRTGTPATPSSVSGSRRGRRAPAGTASNAFYTPLRMRLRSLLAVVGPAEAAHGHAAASRRASARDHA
ncbi:hypothetical protein [Luteimonas deserti]|uniref:Uncharacterized protein n=1 Tax=Luteimonas deserti TaxID=2752306 RepID=A0A7Z0TUE6_9GAMM|nr:hypothetical protein [Luteimonas deserti]NYZ62766.1 hypothetical protein [Luteimonas deserti]